MVVPETVIFGRKAKGMKREDSLAMKAIAICFKQYLKPEEAMIYCNLEKTRFAIKCEEHGIYKNNSGYYKREDLDRFLSGHPPLSMDERLKALKRHRER